MKKTHVITLLAFLLFGYLTAGVSPAGALDNPFISPRGSCDNINGVTAIVSIFVNDPYHSWDFRKDADNTSYSNAYYRLGTAVRWLEDNLRRYGADPHFIWDWMQPYLYSEYTSDRLLSDSDYVYGEIRDHIRDNIDLKRIKEVYNADNVLFIAFYNQDRNDPDGGFAWNWDGDPNGGSATAYEILWITDEDRGVTVSAAGLAHEIMHAFGAEDLYRKTDAIPQAYIDHLTAIGSNDIMFSIDYYTPDSIGETFTDVDAYYMGLLSDCADRRAYNLGQNAHTPYTASSSYLPDGVTFTMYLDINDKDGYLCGVADRNDPDVYQGSLSSGEYYAPAAVLWNSSGRQIRAKITYELDGRESGWNEMVLDPGVNLIYRTFEKPFMGSYGKHEIKWYYNGNYISTFRWRVR